MDQSSITIYTYDTRCVFSGAVEVDPMGAVPRGLMSEPPVTEGTEVAQAQGDKWVVLPSYPLDPPAPPVESIPMLNLQLVLIDDGHLATVQGAITSMEGEDGMRARAHWDKALTARRDNPLVNQLWPMLYEDEAAFNEAWARAAAMNP